MIEPAAMRVLILGDVMGRPARHAVRDLVPALVRDENVDLVVANAENAAGGLGVATTLDEYRAKYRQVRSDPNVRKLLAAVALWTGWDDHEVANDYCGLDPSLSPEQQRAAYQAFFEYMPVRDSRPRLCPSRQRSPSVTSMMATGSVRGKCSALQAGHLRT